MKPVSDILLVRGGGDLGTGVAHALHLAGWRVIVHDRPLPTALRLTVAFAAAAVEGEVTVCGVRAVHARDVGELEAAWRTNAVALWTRDEAALPLRPRAIVDARMRGLTELATRLGDAELVIGIGPGFVAGQNAHLVIESNRGPNLGRVIAEGTVEPYTGIPGEVLGYRAQRLLVAPRAGLLAREVGLGDFVEAGQVVARVAGEPIVARIAGMVRGLKLDGVPVGEGHKVGDVDPRRDRRLLAEMTDKAVAIGRGAVEAVSKGLGQARPNPDGAVA